ncbi:alpha/beta fold hydrolase [Mycobacterium sp. URHB0044]|uniref:alpha/beta fold hydrolase n=1 Tax=Mycobacterium sp. URHB0044 TaxID=1380386 RepID=UPI00048F03B5|nr:alpha/beta hydrolase [Mycobacterium sp. URHB0044]
MNAPALVLVHGGMQAADSWDLTVAEIARLAPDLRVLAVDLPGRPRNPVPLPSVSIAGWVASVVADVEQAGFDEIVLAGHSLAGVTVPAVVAALGWPRVREMILVAAFVPPAGQAVVDAVRGPLARYARWGARRDKAGAIPWMAARWLLCNGMSPLQRNFLSSRLCAESARVIGETVDPVVLPPELVRSWVMTTRDRILPPRAQRRSIIAIGGVHSIELIDACHQVMVSNPRELAHIFVQRCEQHVGDVRH